MFTSMTNEESMQKTIEIDKKKQNDQEIQMDHQGENKLQPSSQDDVEIEVT